MEFSSIKSITIDLIYPFLSLHIISLNKITEAGIVSTHLATTIHAQSYGQEETSSHSDTIDGEKIVKIIIMPYTHAHNELHLHHCSHAQCTWHDEQRTMGRQQRRRQRRTSSKFVPCTRETSSMYLLLWLSVKWVFLLLLLLLSLAAVLLLPLNPHLMLQWPQYKVWENERRASDRCERIAAENMIHSMVMAQVNEKPSHSHFPPRASHSRHDAQCRCVTRILWIHDFNANLKCEPKIKYALEHTEIFISHFMQSFVCPHTQRTCAPKSKKFIYETWYLIHANCEPNEGTS